MEVSKELVNHTTNAAAVVVGVPDLIQGATQLFMGDLVGGGFLVIKGLVEFVAFYLMGK